MTNNNAQLAQKTARNTVWSYAATYGGKALVFISTIILGNLLTKQDFGVVGIALTVIAFLEVMQDLGIGAALIYHRDETAAHSAFWQGLVIASTLFAATWFGAPAIAAFMSSPNQPQPASVVPIIRALGLSFPLFALRNIHDALLRKNLQFKKRFIPDLTQVLAKGGIAITLATLNFGPWSLVWGQLGGSALSVVAFWFVNPWRPRWQFNRAVSRALLSYGTTIVSVNLLSVVLARIDYIFVGRYLSTEALGIYTMAFQIPDLLVMQFCVVISSVMFPMYTRLQDDPQGMQTSFLTTLRFVTLVTVPLALGTALVAEPFVLSLLTAKWAEAIPVMRAIAIYTLFLSLSFNVGDVYKAQGRPGILTKLSLVRVAILVPALWWATTRGSIVTVGWTHAVVALIGTIINLIFATRLLKLSFGSLFDAMRPALLTSAVMAIAVLTTLVALRGTPSWVQLIVAIVVGIGSYGGTLWWTQREIVDQASQTLFGAFARR